MAADTGRTGEPDVLDRPIDWERAERSPEFRELVAARRRFVLPATIWSRATRVASPTWAGNTAGSPTWWPGSASG